MYRHNPQTRRLGELVSSGAIGRLRLIRTAFSFRLTDPENIRLSAELEGGALMDVGCYCVSGARLLGGEPELVHGAQVKADAGVDTVFAGLLRFPDEVVGQIDCGLALPERDELEVIGEEGSLFLDDPWHCRTPVIELRRDGQEVERIELPKADSYRLELENFSDAIRGTAEPLLGRDDAVGQARTIEALHRSAATGETVCTMSLRAAVIGYGLAGRVFHAPLIAAVDGLEVCAIVTSDPRPRAASREQLPRRAILASADELWRDPGLVDLLAIAAPNRAHVTLALAGDSNAACRSSSTSRPDEQRRASAGHDPRERPARDRPDGLPEPPFGQRLPHCPSD